MTKAPSGFHGDRYERHKIFLYRTSADSLGGLEEIIQLRQTGLMPDYDFDEFDRRQAEYLRGQEEPGGRGMSQAAGQRSSPYQDDDDRVQSHMMTKINW